MELSDQVCSLIYAKELKELGIEHESLFYYLNIDGEGEYYIYFNEHLPEYFEYKGDPLSAFTTAELLNVLPAFIDTKINEPFNIFYLTLYKRSSKNIQYIINYECDTYIPDLSQPPTLLGNSIYDEKLSDCLAKMIIYLLKNGIAKIEERITAQ